MLPHRKLLGLICLSLGAAARIVQLDDSDPRINYNTGAVIWINETGKADQPWFDGSLHYSNSPKAWYSFSFTGVRNSRRYACLLMAWIDLAGHLCRQKAGPRQVSGDHRRAIRRRRKLSAPAAGSTNATQGDAFEADVTEEVAPVELFNISGRFYPFLVCCCRVIVGMQGSSLPSTASTCGTTITPTLASPAPASWP
jgi:hypothetical protein